MVAGSVTGAGPALRDAVPAGLTRWEVAVVGAGPAGCATALALARGGRIPAERICLLDAGRESDEPGSDARTAVGETVPPDTRVLLQMLGLWDAFVADEHLPCPGSRSAWGQEALGYNDFLVSPYGPGWHLDRRRFDRMLHRGVTEAGVTLLPGTRLDAVAAEADGWLLGPDRARFLVDATGTAASVARKLGARRRDCDQLVAVYAFLDASAAPRTDRSTLLEATEDGWWYAAALPGGRLAAAFAADAPTIRRRRLTEPANWSTAARATVHLSAALAGCRPPEALLARSAPSFRLDPPGGPGWLAVGDAAASYDPLAAQGIHKALADGLRAADTIAAALQTDRAGPDPVATHTDLVNAAFAGYRQQRSVLYRLERRWPDAPFWRSRQGTGQPR